MKLNLKTIIEPLTHTHCGTDKCCGQCEQSKRIEKSAYQESGLITRLFKYFKGVYVYLKYGEGDKKGKRS